jgi:beta-mannosidase
VLNPKSKQYTSKSIIAYKYPYQAEEERRYNMASLELSLSNYTWQWKDNDAPPTDWFGCVTFPTVIHHELETVGKIEDPFVEENEQKIQWVGRKDWCFRTSFPTPPESSLRSSAVLAFDGLDTIATVHLNGKEILKCDNMFTPKRVDVTARLSPVGRDNELHIFFDSAERVGKERQVKYGMRKSIMRDSGRLYVRKVSSEPHHVLFLSLSNLETRRNHISWA